VYFQAGPSVKMRHPYKGEEKGGGAWDTKLQKGVVGGGGVRKEEEGEGIKKGRE
jgi:hypothetical protein